MRLLFLSLGFLLLSACSKPPDLTTPCPDYGRFCPQTPINVD
ncbi:T4SS-associated protein LvhB7 [Legionella erythra]|nr:T4SS-associated protein LvhB7 [Legionella erythra]